ncbi:thioredoxin family protein [Macrococcus sp. DPC7161]|uniref:thioredoxin family protein n=1 Tax=Macrococcus sp. DPC7161 TaxID=2507060 RepID=UPI0021042124|nr:thioredoxin family protein [Macrococcus sp. DPC7161]
MDSPSNIQIIFGFTPFCATCKMAEHMLKIATESLSLTYAAIDLNYEQSFIAQNEIMSVPVLVIIQEQEVKEIIYRFESVMNLYQILKKYVD